MNIAFKYWQYLSLLHGPLKKKKAIRVNWTLFSKICCFQKIVYTTAVQSRFARGIWAITIQNMNNSTLLWWDGSRAVTTCYAVMCLRGSRSRQGIVGTWWPMTAVSQLQTNSISVLNIVSCLFSCLPLISVHFWYYNVSILLTSMLFIFVVLVAW